MAAKPTWRLTAHSPATVTLLQTHAFTCPALSLHGAGDAARISGHRAVILILAGCVWPWIKRHAQDTLDHRDLVIMTGSKLIPVCTNNCQSILVNKART